MKPIFGKAALLLEGDLSPVKGNNSSLPEPSKNPTQYVHWAWLLLLMEGRGILSINSMSSQVLNPGLF